MLVSCNKIVKHSEIYNKIQKHVIPSNDCDTAEMYKVNAFSFEYLVIHYRHLQNRKLSSSAEAFDFILLRNRAV